MLADGGVAALTQLSRCSHAALTLLRDVAMEVEAGQSAPVPLSPSCFPRSQSDRRIRHQTTGAIGCLILCAHGVNPMRQSAGRGSCPWAGRRRNVRAWILDSKRVRFGRQGTSSSCVSQKSSLDVSPARSPAPAPRSLLAFEATEGQGFGEHASWTWGVQPPSLDLEQLSQSGIDFNCLQAWDRLYCLQVWDRLYCLQVWD
jgi:hypothetical protein